jgi:putative endonuclease
MKAYMYILLCNDGSYYTGSTRDLEQRLEDHFSGAGANYTRKHKPIKLVYYEEFDRIDEAYYREKQVQGWSRKKKEALINGMEEKLPELSKNYTQFGKYVENAPSTSSGSEKILNSDNRYSTNLTSNTSKIPPVELVETKGTESRNNIYAPSTSSGSEEIAH